MSDSENPTNIFDPSSGLEGAIREMADAVKTLVTSNKADNEKAATRAEKTDRRARNMLFMLGAATALLLVGTFGIGFTACVTHDNTRRVNELTATVADLATETRLAKEEVTSATEQAKEIAAAAPRVEVIPPPISPSVRPKGPRSAAPPPPQLAVVIPARTATPKTSAAPAAPAAPAVTVLIPTPSAIVVPEEAPSQDKK